MMIQITIAQRWQMLSTPLVVTDGQSFCFLINTKKAGYHLISINNSVVWQSIENNESSCIFWICFGLILGLFRICTHGICVIRPNEANTHLTNLMAIQSIEFSTILIGFSTLSLDSIVFILTAAGDGSESLSVKLREIALLSLIVLKY